MKQLLLFFALLLASLSADAQEEEYVTIDGLKYCLTTDLHMAVIENGNSWIGELDIPEKVTYNNEEYTVVGMRWMAFDFCKTLTKVRIPKTIELILYYTDWDEFKNPFFNCSSLECIEVDEDNLRMCSVDGVLFNKDKTRLYSYPTGKKQKGYSIPESVTWIGADAFACNPYLETVTMPNSVTWTGGDIFGSCARLKSVRLSENLKFIRAYTFDNCASLTFLEIPESVKGFGEGVFRWCPLETIVIRGMFPDELRSDTFYFMDEATVMYVQQSEVEKFKKVFPGTVFPLESYDETGMKPLENTLSDNSYIFDLQGRRIQGEPAKKGVYLKNGKKYVKK